MATPSIAKLLREDGKDAAQRGEGTSRLETRLENDAARAESSGNEWLAACADGSVSLMEGEPNAAALVKPGETELDKLRQVRIAQMKARASERQAWLARGHGAYASIDGDAAFISAANEHERLVCHVASETLESRMLHAHLRAISRVHLETYFCTLDASRAPMMLAMVEMGRLPAVLLARDGKVVQQLVGVDRSFTTEGLAYELASHGLIINFEEGANYAEPPSGGCTAATAGRADAARARGYRPADHELDHSSDDLSD